jgi:antitoxin HigA-1
LSITTEDDEALVLDRVSSHPGEVLREEFMRPFGLSANALARELHVPPNRITAIISAHAPRAITPDTALRLARYFGTTARFWLNLQQNHDLSIAARDTLPRIEREVLPRSN